MWMKKWEAQGALMPGGWKEWTESRTEVGSVWFMRSILLLVARLMIHLPCEGSDVPEREPYLEH